MYRDRTFARVAFCSAVLVSVGRFDSVVAQDLEDAVVHFWSVTDEQLEGAKRRIAEMDVGFDDVYDALRASDRYTANVPKGRYEVVRANADGTVHPFVVMVPSNYDATKAHPVRVYLHGGVRRPAWDSGGRWWRRYDQLARGDEIAVFPAAWGESTWWQASQAENLAGILRELKATYNVDDNRVYLFGVSDGGTGAYFHAFRAATPWAAFVPMIGHPSVLANPRVGADGEMFPINLSNRPFYVLNGETDRLYPAARMVSWIRFFESSGVDITFRRVNSGHTVEWWPHEADGIERFITAKVRDPLPERLVWETERTDRYNRLHWLRVDDLDPLGSHPPEATNDPFPHERPSGRIDAERHGNNVVVEARGVARFSLLLSPDEFDFAAPITVTVNGTVQFQGMVEKDVNVLLDWTAKDRDRTMLFAATLQILVP